MPPVTTKNADNSLTTAAPGVQLPSEAFSAGSIPLSVLNSSPKPVNFVNPNPVILPDITKLDTTTPTPALSLTQTEQSAQEITKRLQGLESQTVGESAFRAQKENELGIPDLTKTQTDLTSRLKSIQNEAAAIPLQLQNEAAGRGITTGGLNPIQTGALRNNAIQALSVSSLLEASRGNLTTAIDLVDRAVKQKFDPIREEIAANKANLDLIINSPEYSVEDKNRAQVQKDFQDKKAKDIAKQEQDAKDIQGLALSAAKNGADALTLNKIQNAKTPDEALATMVASGFVNDPNDKAKAAADLAYTKAQTQKIYADIGKINADIEAGKPIDVSKLVPANAPAEVKNNTVLTTLLQNPKIGQGTRTNIGNVLGVIQAVEDMAKNNPSGSFTGINPINTLLNVKIPFTDIGLPFRQASKQQGSIQNEGYINAINLQTQVWASGAALTNEQTEQVRKLTPTVNDTDANVRTKLNNLANYMLTQTSARLQSEGINYQPEKVNLFETRDMIAKLSPAQKKELEDQGLLPEWAKNTSSSAVATPFGVPVK